MNKFQHEIDKILELLYNNDNNTYYSKINNKIIKIFENRIGNCNLIESKNEKQKNNVISHYNKICGYDPNCQECLLNKFCNYYRRKVILEQQNDNLKLVDLFCGAGGFSLGFTQEGFKTIFAIDNQECCVDTYRVNHPEIAEELVICNDIENINIGEKIGMDVNIDVVIGGPPCQGFSMANRQRMIDDPRNRLYKQFVKNVEMLKPKFFVMENVEGILKIKDEIIEDFSQLEEKYKVDCFKINAVDYGVPQNRKRVFFIGTRLNIDVKVVIDKIKIQANKSTTTVLKDALFGLRSLKAEKEKNKTSHDSIESGSIIELNKFNDQNKYIKLINIDKINTLVFNHKARYNNERDITIFSLLEPGDRSDDLKIAHIMPYKNRSDIFKDKYYRLYPDKPCKTITAHMKYDCNMYINPYEARGLTPREAARVQSFPDDYYFCGPYTKTYMQIGNSVPPLVAKTIAKVIKEIINNKIREI